MERPKSPYQEITSPENTDIHGSLRTGSWGNLQTLEGRATFLRAVGSHFEADLLDSFNDKLIRTSGSIEGKHRESTVNAVQGQKAPPLALVGTQPPPPGKAPV